MSDTNFTPAGSAGGAALPFVSIDIPDGATGGAPAATAGPGAGSRAADRSAPFVSVDVPADATRAADASPGHRGSGSGAPLPFVSIDIPGDAG